MRWMLDILKETPDPQKRAGIFASFPAYFMKDMLDYIDYTAKYQTRTLAQSQLATMFEFCVVFMNQTSLVKSPLIRARLVFLLATFQYLFKLPPPAPVATGWKTTPAQPTQPYVLTEQEKICFGYVFVQTQNDDKMTEQLITGLIRCYLDIGDVEVICYYKVITFLLDF